MAINFPTALDDFTNPLATDSMQTVSHSSQHSNVNDAIEALELKIGINGSTDVNSIDYKINQLNVSIGDINSALDTINGEII